MKKILLSLSMIALAGVVVLGATGAFFSDSETSTGNTFTAGAIDLQIDNESYITNNEGVLVASATTSWAMNDLTNELFFNFADVKPGDVGEDTISMHVENNDAWACMAINLTGTPENGQTEPELAVPDTTIGVNEGELQNELKFVFWNDDGDNVYEVGESAFWQNQTIAQISQAGTVVLADSTGTGVLGATPLVGDSIHYIGKAWCYGDMTLAPVAQDEQGKIGTNGPLARGTGITCSGASATNISQTDGILANVSFTAEQSRNNANFRCVPPTGSGTLTVIKTVVNGGVGTATADQFTMNVTGGTPSSFAGSVAGTSVTIPANVPYVVTEGEGPAGYSATYSAGCSGNMVEGANATCTVTNRYVLSGLTVTKIVEGSEASPNSFPLFATSVVGNITTPMTNGVSFTNFAPGQYIISETPNPDYTSVFSGDCAPNGAITLPGDGSVACTITNTLKSGTLIVNKNVVTRVAGTTTTAADFQLMVDGNNVVQGASNTVTTGTHTVSEAPNPNYVVSFSAGCPGGVATITPGATVTCTVTNTQRSATLTLNKVVRNINGGNNVMSDFTLYASGGDATTQVANGVPTVVAIGPLYINEQGVTGYQAVFSGDCNTGGQITLNEGDNKQCTITNTDIAPNITLSKVVDSGTASPYSFVLRLDGTIAPTASSVAVTSNSPHVINEDAKAGYHFVSITGDAKCPAVLGGSATLTEGETISCVIHNAAN